METDMEMKMVGIMGSVGYKARNKQDLAIYRPR